MFRQLSSESRFDSSAPDNGFATEIKGNLSAHVWIEEDRLELLFELLALRFKPHASQIVVFRHCLQHLGDTGELSRDIVAFEPQHYDVTNLDASASSWVTPCP